MRNTLGIVGCLLALGALSHCKGDFDSNANTYACKSKSECLPGFLCVAHPSVEGTKVCTPGGQSNADVLNQDLLGDASITSDTKQLKADTADTLLQVDSGCTSDEDCPEAEEPCMYIACEEGVCAEAKALADGESCDDGDPCTEQDTCQNSVCLGLGVAEGAVCKDDDLCTVNTRCNADGLCAGEPKCKSSLDCVVATCDEGVCTFEGGDSFCLVKGECYANGAIDPQDPCRFCDPQTNKTAFSNKADGAECDNNNPCTNTGACVDKDNSGVMTCEGVEFKINTTPCMPDSLCSTGACFEGKCNANSPLKDGAICDDGDPCTTNDVCETGSCVGSLSECPASAALPCADTVCGPKGCDIEVKAGFCVCEGTCFANGEVNPNNPCQRCNTNEQTTAWSAVPDGSACGLGECAGECKQGKCSQESQFQCVTDDACYALGEPHPKYPCHECVLIGSVAAWSPMETGAICFTTYPNDSLGFCKADPKGHTTDCIWNVETAIDTGVGGWMGCAECGYPDQMPVHYVAIEPFSMDATEVTADLFISCMQAGACSYDFKAQAAGNNGGIGFEADYKECALQSNEDGPGVSWKVKKPYQPMNCVTQKEAAIFCGWLGKDLCTEAQWERVAVGGCLDGGLSPQQCEKPPDFYVPPVYPWGGLDWADTMPPSCQLAQTNACEFLGVRPVLNDAGVLFGKAKFYDVWGLSGNVAEWVKDDYHPSYDGAPTDGSAWIGDGAFAIEGVTRGGGYQDSFPATSTIFRYGRLTDWRSSNVGFRCCRN